MDATLRAAKGPSDQGNWVAHLDVQFAQREGKTKVAHSSHVGPLRIQRAFYPETNGTAHLYLLHPPGGVAGGDHLTIQIESGESTRALVTTPAATKLYRSSGPRAVVQQNLAVHKGAILEWLPQETIAYAGAQVDLKTLVHLEDDAQFIGWEILCLGRPASGDGFEHGRIGQRFELWQNDAPLYIDRLAVGEGSSTRQAVWGMNNKSVVATMLITTQDRGLLNLIRHVLDLVPTPLGVLGCTALRGLTLIRYLGNSVPECFSAMVRVWEAVRPVITASSAVAPRIWNC